MLFMAPRRVRRGIVQMEGERLFGMVIDELNGAIRKEIRHIFIQILRDAVDAHVGMLVRASAAEQDRPFIKARAGTQTVTHVPFSHESHAVSRFPEGIVTGRHSREVVHGSGISRVCRLQFFREGRAGNIACAQPIVDTMGRRESAGRKTASRRRADGGRAEEIPEIDPFLCHPVQIGRDDFRRLPAERPGSLIVCQNKY